MTKLIYLNDVSGTLASMLARQSVRVSEIKLAVKLTNITSAGSVLNCSVGHRVVF